MNNSKSKGAVKKNKIVPKYYDVDGLLGYIQDTRKILPSRITGLKPKEQRALANSIKRARYLALLPYCPNHDSSNYVVKTKGR